MKKEGITLPKIRITPLHCVDCAAELVEQLEEASGRPGFSYNEEQRTLKVPEGIDRDRLEHVLNADKIYILPDQEEHPEAVHRHDGQPTDKAPGHHHAEVHHKGGGHHDHGTGLRAGSSERNILLVFILNLVFSIIEFIAGFLLNSTSIFSDAIHDFGDALSVGLAFLFEKLSKRHRNQQFTFGHRRFSLLGALITGTFLIVGAIFSLTRAIPRLLAPEPVNYSGMLYLALAAIVMNGLAAWLLLGRRSKNESMLTVHMLEDLMGWVGILIISVILHFRPWFILDPIVSILISLYILKEAIPQTVDTVKILLESVPEGVDLKGLEQSILAVKGVHGVRHLHFWSMDGEENNFAVTLFTDCADVKEQQRIRRQVQDLLPPRGVNCATIQIDYDPAKLILGS